MGKRTKFEDIASMALLYIYKASGSKMISYDKVVEFDKVINENLDNMNSTIDPFLYYDEESKIYFHATDENGMVYLVIDPQANIELAQDYHIGCLPLDIIVASQMDNALNVLGLQLVDGKIIKNNNLGNKLYFGIYDEVSVTNVDLNGKKSILIRIFEPSSYKENHLEIINSSSYKSILELYINDFVRTPENNCLSQVFKRLNDFILKNDFDEVIVHCTLGVSRSPAIMICIAKILNSSKLEDIVRENFKYYNEFIVDAFEKFPYTIKQVVAPLFILENNNNNLNYKEKFVKKLTKNI